MRRRGNRGRQFVHGGSRVKVESTSSQVMHAAMTGRGRPVNSSETVRRRPSRGSHWRCGPAHEAWADVDKKASRGKWCGRVEARWVSWNCWNPRGAEMGGGEGRGGEREVRGVRRWPVWLLMCAVGQSVSREGQCVGEGVASCDQRSRTRTANGNGDQGRRMCSW